MSKRFIPALVLSTLALMVCSGPRAGLAADGDAAAREWNQTRGNASRTSIVDVEPVRGEPSVAWTRECKTVQGSPVTWGGVLYVVADGDLLALDPVTGEERAKQRLFHTDPVELAVWQGTVMVSRAKDIRAFTFTGDSFKGGWRKSGSWRGGLGVYEGVLFVGAAAGGIHAIEVRTGKQSREPAQGDGMAAIDSAGDDILVYSTARVESEDPALAGATLFTSRLTIDRSKGPVFTQVAATNVAKPLGMSSPFDEVIRIRSAEPGGPATSLLHCGPGAMPGAGESLRGALFPDGASRHTGSSEIRMEPAVHGDAAYGFSDQGALLRVQANGKSRALVEKSGLRSDTLPGAASGSGEVLYFGNWAIDIDHGRILWSLPDLHPVGQVIPTGDKRLVMVTQDQRILGLADPTAPGAAPGGTDGASTAAPVVEPQRTVELPDESDGVLLMDGRFVRGSFGRVGDQLRIVPVKGEAFEAAYDAVLVAQKGGKADITGDEYEVYDLWRTGIEATLIAGLVDVFDGLVAAGCVEEAAQILEECSKIGIDSAREGAMHQALAGKRQHPNADVRRKKWITTAAECRTTAADAALRGAQWCAARELRTAATVLLGVAERAEPGRAGIEELAQGFIPEAFPWREEQGATRLWMSWAGEILPARAEFLTPTDSGWRNARNAPWNEDGTVALRTPNLLFFSRVKDPSIVGACLRNGEGAVRTLRVLLGTEGDDPVRGDTDRLDVRLHTDRKSYLAEELPGGGKAIEWSAGFFSPAEGVSRFYVPTGRNDLTLGRDLYRTLVHELTHHYVERRWMPHFSAQNRGTIEQGGYWVVEGFARFVEDQSVEIGRRGVRFDDPTVPSVDCTIQLLGKKSLMPVSELVDLTYVEFHKLPQSTVAQVTLRSSLESYNVDGIKRFYEEAGALVYFMLNGRGDDGRYRLINYLKARYSGRVSKQGWIPLGFANAEEFDAAFCEYLQSIAR